jgi:hypothetical protein
VRVTIRRLLIGTLFAGVLGTVAELLLLDHSDAWLQLVPPALLGLALPAVHGSLRFPVGQVYVCRRS